MENRGVKLVIATAMGMLGGLLLGRYLWGLEERKGKLSDHLLKLGDIVKELEEIETHEAQDLKAKLSKLITGIEQEINSTDGTAE